MRVTCVVDDAVQRSSAFWGEHGVAFLIESEGWHVLFDTGQSGTVLLHNLNVLEVKPSNIDAIAISHAHYDHTGGLPVLLEHVDPGTVLYANPDLFRERYSVLDDELGSIGMRLTRGDLSARLSLMLKAEGQEIVPGIWTTGTITERPDVEGSSERHRMREEGAIVSDLYLDDMALVLARDAGLTLLCGCCHAGLLNTLAQARRMFQDPVEIIAGGLHLTSATEEELDSICQVLKEQPALRRIYPNHCTGEAAFVALTNALGPSVVRALPAGTTFDF